MTCRSAKRPSWRAVAFVGATAIVTGCAVMRVDVDVYKGPLANHRDVQLQQFAAMAIAAKPLLIQLRNTLEWPTNTDNERAAAQKVGWYRDDYVSPFTAKENQGFTKTQAKRVNAILGLYKDKSADALGSYVEGLTKAFRAYDAAFNRYSLPKDEAAERWRSFGFEKNKNGSQKQLLDAYKPLLSPEGKSLPNFQLLAVRLKEVGICPDDSWNCAAKRLRDEKGLLDGHATLLFDKTKKSEAQNFVASVRQTVGAYFDIRENIREMWELSADATLRINAPFATPPADQQKLNRAVARVIAATTQIRALNVAMCSAKAPTSVNGELKSVLRMRAGESHEDDFNPWAFSGPSNTKKSQDEDQKRNNEVGKRAAKILEDAIVADPSGVATRLLLADKFFREANEGDLRSGPGQDKNGTNQNLCLENNDFFASANSRAFGLVRTGTTPASVRDIDPNELAEPIQGVTVIVAGGLERGRLDRGLESLIDDYLRLTADPDHRPKELDGARKLMKDALIRFAAKVLVIADHEVLLKDNSGDPYGDPTVGTTLDRYTLVLQAIGNAIIVEADDLHRQDSHADVQTRDKAGEVNAVNLAYATYPAKVLDDMSLGIRDSPPPAGADADQYKKEIENTVAAIEKYRADVIKKLLGGRKPVNARAVKDELLRLLEEEAKNKKSSQTDKTDNKKSSAIAPSPAGWTAKAVGAQRRPAPGYMPAAARSPDDQQPAPPAVPVQPVERELLAGRLAPETATAIAAASGSVTENTAPKDGNTPADSAGSKPAPETGNNNASKAIDDARKLIANYPLPIDSPVSSDMSAASNREVLDRVIAALRHEHIKTVQQFGKDSPAAKYIAEAIKTAYDQRAGMAYLRPAVAYLRSSYAATGLQSNIGEVWHNMLGEHSLRSVPLFGGALANPEENRLRVQREIDKQFWQNINSVRVGGAGDTNYVIAKDDIGNWYVKAYSADPKEIIESARNLALFGMGSALNQDLLNRVTRRETGSGAEVDDVSRTTLGRVFAKYETKYAETTEEDRTKLLELMADAGLKESIGKKWAAPDTTAISDAKANLDANAAQLVKDRKGLEDDKDKDGKPLTAGAKGRKIVSALRAVIRFAKNLNRDIRALPDGTDAAAGKQAKTNLTAAVDQVVGDAVKELHGRRAGAADKFNTAIVFIGDAAKTPPPPKAAEPAQAPAKANGTGPLTPGTTP